jgi:type I restriction enzyme M protein
MNNFNDKVSFIWSVADLLRGPYKPAQYGDVMLPLVVLRRLDCVLEPTKPKVLERFAALKSQKHTEAKLDAILNRAAKPQFHCAKTPSPTKACSRLPKPTRWTTSPTSSTRRWKAFSLTAWSRTRTSSPAL